ncbi:VWA domain-containing protein [Nocardioides sp. LMS-CY]|uniref:vWA domain-containing protein n=1 Tax=Nocardioides sp. (strain LMS-CY) TaxID=2840457 RepID=UPI001C00133E|nr:vWA domain-containing protein [Nocardioides sp. LMS-CY]QWF24275.1 VWA domain-containing protein [Nocardioides sp. LMS-CY]
MTGSDLPRDERGAIAVISAVVAVVLFGFAALAVDLADLVNERQELHDTLDMAAQAGAGKLPADGAGARAAALANAHANDPDASPDVDFFCVVGSKASGSTYVVDTTHIPLSCNPGSAPYTASAYPGLACNGRICAIPCVPEQGDLCNTLRVRDEKDVPYVFAPVIGVDEGETGSLTSVACQGACGSIPANPIDMVVVGDRTGSMGSAIRNLEDAIKGLLEYLTPSQHRVALGTIGRSSGDAPLSCKSRPSTSKSSGPWIPVGFSSTYDDTDVHPPTTPPVLSASDPLALAVDCIGNTSSSTGTYLAAPMRAARELLASSAARPAPVRKAIIFMTDGEPNEDTNPGDGYPYSSNGTTACNNLVNEAASAKNAGILVVTIAFRLDGTRCNGGGSALVTERLATAASNRPDGTPSKDDGGGAGPGCDTTAEQNGENADGDFFFCTPTPEALAPLFQTAASAIVQGTRLIRLP